eukprot:11639613-Alexandrium_andersonii.AAC.1
MSASLVGSEMCIRDRATNARAQTRTRARETCAKAHECPVQGKRTPRAVSYTHLTLPTICSV